VPRPRLEESEILVEHLIHVAEELYCHAVGVLMIDRDVMADDVADRPPSEQDVVARQQIAGARDIGPIAHLECNVMN
jgi:hypothetical protein